MQTLPLPDGAEDEAAFAAIVGKCGGSLQEWTGSPVAAMEAVDELLAPYGLEVRLYADPDEQMFAFQIIRRGSEPEGVTDKGRREARPIEAARPKIS
jgi:hypothetical protein